MPTDSYPATGPRNSGFACELAEAIGAFTIVLVGCGAIISLRAQGAAAAPAIAAAFGAAVAVCVYSMAHVSGAHFNPAVTIGFAAVGRFPWNRVPRYVAAQLVGASAASALLLWSLGNFASLGATTLAPGVSIEKAIALEAVFTFLLAFVIAGAASDGRAPRAGGGLAIGLAVVLGAIVAGPATGASLNPARSFGPALVGGTWGDFAIYIIGPVIGAVAGFMVYEQMRNAVPPTKDRREQDVSANTQPQPPEGRDPA